MIQDKKFVGTTITERVGGQVAINADTCIQEIQINISPQDQKTLEKLQKEVDIVGLEMEMTTQKK